MKNRLFVTASFAAVLLAGSAVGQTPDTVESHIVAARVAAGMDYRNTLLNLCPLFPATSGTGRGRGALPLTAPRPAPDRATWYASPYKIFDNLYWLGTRQHSSGHCRPVPASSLSTQTSHGLRSRRSSTA